MILLEYYNEYYFDTEEKTKEDKVYVLIIYDIIDNKSRQKLAKYLQGYGFRVQKSAFEATITKSKYNKLINEMPAFVSEGDSIKVYKIIGKGQVTSFGVERDIKQEEIIVI